MTKSEMPSEARGRSGTRESCRKAKHEVATTRKAAKYDCEQSVGDEEGGEALIPS